MAREGEGAEDWGRQRTLSDGTLSGEVVMSGTLHKSAYRSARFSFG